MSKSLNEVTLVGNVGKDPETKVLTGGNVQATFTLATSTGGYTGRDGKEIPEKTQWHNIVVWGAQASVVEKYIKKGSRLLVKGRIEYRDYEKDGQKRYVTEIIATDLMLLSQPMMAESYTQPSAAPQPQPFSDALPF